MCTQITMMFINGKKLKQVFNYGIDYFTINTIVVIQVSFKLDKFEHTASFKYTSVVISNRMGLPEHTFMINLAKMRIRTPWCSS